MALLFFKTQKVWLDIKKWYIIQSNLYANSFEEPLSKSFFFHPFDIFGFIATLNVFVLTWRCQNPIDSGFSFYSIAYLSIAQRLNILWPIYKA